MGKRQEPRKPIRVPVRIFGTDRHGQIFSEKVFTVNVSRHGVELSGVEAEPNLDEIIGLTYGPIKRHFRVRWVGQAGSPKGGHLGLLYLSPAQPLWDFPLPEPSPDTSAEDVSERRRYPRIRCMNSIEIYPSDQPSPIRARTSDMSLAGCFIEMSNPLPKGSEARIAVWVKALKLWAKARVVSSVPGHGGLEWHSSPCRRRRKTT